MRAVLGLLFLGAVGCASSKPCADGTESKASSAFGVSTASTSYNPCNGPCHRTDDPLDCACSRRCPCWNYHKTSSPQHEQDVERKETARKETERKDFAEQQYQFDQGKDHHLHGRYAEAMVIFKKLYFYYPNGNVAGPAAYNVSCEYAVMGDRELALEWLENAFKHGWKNVEYTKQDKDLDTLRDEPRYKKLVGE